MCVSITRLCGVLTATFLLLSASLAAAQDSNTCTSIPATALSQLSTVCGQPGSNSACYGSETVTAGFADGVMPAPSINSVTAST